MAFSEPAEIYDNFYNDQHTTNVNNQEYQREIRELREENERLQHQAFLQAFVYLLTFLLKCLEYIFDVFQIRRQAFALTHPNNQDSSCKFLLRATTLIVSFSICQPT